MPSDWRTRTTLSVDEAVPILGASRNTVYNAIAAGQIPGVRVGHRILVPVVPLRRLLGELTDADATNGHHRTSTKN